MLSIWLLIFLVPGIKTFEPYEEEEEIHKLPIEVSSCYPSDFVNGGKCTLSCYVSYDNITEEYQWIDWGIRYSSANDNNSLLIDTIQIFTNTTADRSEAWLISYTMDSYNAGYYICLFEFVFNDTIDFVQKVSIRIDDTTQGSFLTESCTKSSDCLPLNSACNANGKCECDSPYDINYNGLDTTPACLKHLSEGDYCHINEECAKVNEDYICIVDCTCDGYKKAISEENNVTMCIAPVYLMQNCVYNEQCQLTANNSYCNPQDGGYCDCAPNYALNRSDSNPQQYFCYFDPMTTTTSTKTPTSGPSTGPTSGPPSGGMSPGAIAGTVIGSVVGVAIIAGLAIFIVKKNK